MHLQPLYPQRPKADTVMSLEATHSENLSQERDFDDMSAPAMHAVPPSCPN